MVPGATALVAARCHAHDYDDPNKPAIAWDDKQARDTLVSARDAMVLVGAFAGAELDATTEQAVALLALVAGQDVKPAEGSDGTDGRWRIARRVAENRVISTVDTEARHVHKTVHHRQDGFKGHVAVEPDTGLFTAGRLAQASGPDKHEAVIGVDLLDEETAGDGGGGWEVLGDTAYGTGQARAELAWRGHTAVIKPMPLRPAVAGGFTSMTSQSTRPRAPRAARTASPGGSPSHAPLSSARPVKTARCTSGSPAALCTCTRRMHCCARPAATGPSTRPYTRPTGGTAPWSNARSPG